MTTRSHAACVGMMSCPRHSLHVLSVTTLTTIGTPEIPRLGLQRHTLTAGSVFLSTVQFRKLTCCPFKFFR